MTKARGAVFAVVSVTGFGVLVGYLTEPRKATIFYQPSLLSPVESMAGAKTGGSRRWSNVTWKEVFTLSAPLIDQPELFDITADGELWVLEWSTFTLKHFSKDGYPLSAIRLSKGPDAAKPGSIAVGTDGDVWVCDIGGSFISYSPDGKVRKVIRQVAPAYRIALVGDKIIGLRVPGRLPEMFDVYSLSGVLVRSVAFPLIQEQVRDGIVLDGYITASGSGDGFLYTGRWFGLLASITPTGQDGFVVRTVDNLALPMITYVHQTSRHVATGSPEAALGVRTAGDDIFILAGLQARTGSTSGEGQVVDVYDGGGGAYKASFALPTVCRAAIVTTRRAYMLTGTRVTVWER